MKRIATWFLSTVSVVVLMFGYHTSTSSVLSSASPPAVVSGSSSEGRATGSSSSSATSGNGSSSGSSSHRSSSGSSGTSGSSTATHTVTGSVAQTQWGPVQVELTVAGSKITDVSVLQYPSGNGTDAQINSYALPVLIQETLNQQSSSIDMVSGATVTSVGYLQSLQSAIDQAGL